jgi:hypothetical protein
LPKNEVPTGLQHPMKESTISSYWPKGFQDCTDFMRKPEARSLQLFKKKYAKPRNSTYDGIVQKILEN